jgi:hypothetical protein
MLRILLLSLSFCWLAAATAAEVQARMVLHTLPLAGFQYYAGTRVWKELQVGDPLTLVREADNPYDPHAVQVLWRGEKLGYVPHAGNETVARLLDKGVSLSARIVHLQAGRSRWQRVLFEVDIDS